MPGSNRQTECLDGDDLQFHARVLAACRAYTTATGRPASYSSMRIALRAALDILPALAETSTLLSLEGLTRREQEIAELVAEGLTNKEVAARLWVSVQTVKFHMSSTYAKLGITNRTQLAARMARQRLSTGESSELKVASAA